MLPRLLTLEGAAAYLSLSPDVVLELVRSGPLAGARVHVPAPVTHRRHGGEVRRWLVDRAALDAAINAWRERP